MKLKSFFTVIIIATTLTQFCNAQTSSFIGSQHDFPTDKNAWNFSPKVTEQLEAHICYICHVTDSNGKLSQSKFNDTTAMKPIWNHLLSNANYKIYSEGYNFWKGGGRTIGNPDGSSKLCLSCHDGTVALSNFRMFMKSMGMSSTTGNATLGTDLSTSHPISFTYDGSLSMIDRKLNNPTAYPSGVRNGTIDEDMLEDHKLQCISCHDVHNIAGANHLLIKSNQMSALCLTCHRM